MLKNGKIINSIRSYVHQNLGLHYSKFPWDISLYSNP